MNDLKYIKKNDVASDPAILARGCFSRRIFILALVFCFCCAGPLFAAHAAKTKAQPPQIVFNKIQDGLELGKVQTLEHGAANAEFVILRIDPAFFEFSLHMATDDGPARTIGAWAEHLGLTAAINAGMYLPDKLTHTGLLHNGTHTNNPRAGARLGAFFVCQALRKNLPEVDILERGDKRLQDKLKNYAHVAQNYRLIGSNGEILWKDDGPQNSIAAVAKDNKGRIMFILCQQAMSAADFSRCLRALPIAVNLTMYVEGGGKSALFVSRPTPAVWSGREDILGIEINHPLPNIIGIRPKK